MGQLSSTACDRTRGYVSASLDGELSQVEGARLETHLASCAACRAYAADVAESSRLLRETALEELDFPIVLPRRRLAVARKLQVAAAAAAIAAAVGLSTVVGTTSQSGRPSTSAAPLGAQSVSLRFPEGELKMLHRASLRNQLSVHARLAL